jgi:hypothetical protein
MTTGSMGDRSNPTLASSTSQSGSGQTGDRTGTTDDVNRAKDAVGEAAQTAKTEASNLGHDLKAHGEQLVHDARARAEDMAEQQKAAGADQVEGMARAAGKAADELEATSPQLAQYVRQAASAAEDFSRSIRNRNFGEILEDVTAYARREPVMFFGITVAAGFAISRFLKSTAERSASGYYGSGPSRAYDSGSGITRSHAYGQSGTRPTTPVGQTSSTPMEYPTGRTSSTDPMHSSTAGTATGQSGARPTTPASQTTSSKDYPAGRTSSTDPMRPSTTGTSTSSTPAGHLGTPIGGPSSTPGGAASSPSKAGGSYR